MRQEFLLIFRAIILTIIWLIIDYRWYKWVGMSPVFGALKEEKIVEKIRNFSFGISAHFLVFSAIIFLYEKFKGKLHEDFSGWGYIGLVFLGAFVLNILSRLGISFHLKKSEEGKNSLLITLSIIGAIVVLIGGAIVVVSGH